MKKFLSALFLLSCAVLFGAVSDWSGYRLFEDGFTLRTPGNENFGGFQFCPDSRKNSAKISFENGKMTREKLQQVLRECREGSLQALRLRWGAPPETLCADGVGPLSRRLTKKQLMRLCEMLGKFAQECRP